MLLSQATWPVSVRSRPQPNLERISEKIRLLMGDEYNVLYMSL